MSKLDFSAVAGHVEHESAPEATATPVLDFSAIPGHVQHSDAAVPEATTLEQTTDEPVTGNVGIGASSPRLTAHGITCDFVYESNKYRMRES